MYADAYVNTRIPMPDASRPYIAARPSSRNASRRPEVGAHASSTPPPAAALPVAIPGNAIAAAAIAAAAEGLTGRLFAARTTICCPETTVATPRTTTSPLSATGFG